MNLPPLPIDDALPRLSQVLEAGPFAVLVAPPGAGKTTRVPLALLEALTLQDLARYPALLPGSNTRCRRLIENLFQQHATPLDVREPSNYLEALRMLVEAGLGWSALPEVMISSGLCRLPLPQYEPARTIMLAYHRKVSLSGPARLFLEWLKEHPPGLHSVA